MIRITNQDHNGCYRGACLDTAAIISLSSSPQQVLICRLVFCYKTSKISDPCDSWTDLCENPYLQDYLITLKVESSDTTDNAK